MIDTIIASRSEGNPVIARTTKIKIAMKGVDPDQFSETSEDDPAVIEKLRIIAQELGVTL